VSIKIAIFHIIRFINEYKMTEQATQLTNDNSPSSNFTVSNTAINYLSETRKWTKFLSIVGFIFIGIIAITGIFSGTVISLINDGQEDDIPTAIGPLFGGIYLLTGVLYFFPTWYLFKFSQQVKIAISTQNNEALNKAFSNQKSLYKFWGILTIITLVIYVPIIIISLFTIGFLGTSVL